MHSRASAHGGAIRHSRAGCGPRRPNKPRRPGPYWLSRTMAVEGIQLRPMVASDEALYVGLYGSPATMRHIGPPLPPLDALRSFRVAVRANVASPPSARFWVIEHRDGQQALGLIGLRWISHTTAELGVVLPEEHQAKGIAKSAIRTLLTPAFTELGLAELRTQHSKPNGLAWRLMDSLGFTATSTSPVGQGFAWRMTADQWRRSGAGQQT